MKDTVYSRRKILAGVLGTAGMTTALATLLNQWSKEPPSETMPALFVGHGTPMSAIRPNEWTKAWTDLGQKLPRPRTILAISAHWLTRGGVLVTGSDAPRMNYDMYGFPEEMYQITYPAPGNVALSQEIKTTLAARTPVYSDTEWGFDHATWVVLKYMFPEADIPVIQLSIDYGQPAQFHYDLGKHLQALRSRGVLVIGSGNMVHNLSIRPGMNNDQPLDWAAEFDSTMAKHIEEGNHQAVVDFLKMGSVASLAHPSHDHFLPLLYTLGLKTGSEDIVTFSDNFQWPAVSMRSDLIG